MAETYPDFNDFLRQHRATDGMTTTHTRIGDSKNVYGKNVYGGKYHIPDDKLDIFHELYYQNSFVENRKEYLTEVQPKINPPTYLDFDFKHEKDVNTRQITDEKLREFSEFLLDTISSCCDDENVNNVKGFVMMKDKVNEKDDFTKDGIHYQFNLTMPRPAQKYLREIILKDKYFKDFCKDIKCVNSNEDIYDEGITKGHVNIQLFGSQKPRHEAYKLVAITSFDDEGNIEYNQDIKMTPDIMKSLSVRTHHEKLTLKLQNNIPIKEPPKKLKIVNRLKQSTTGKSKVIDITDRPCDIDFECFTKEDKELADIIDVKYIDNYHDWTKLIWSCRVDNNFQLAHYISSKGQKYDDDASETKKIWDNFTDSRNGFSKATFYHYCKISDPDKYTEIRAKYHSFTEINGFTDNDLAKTFCKLYGCDHIYNDKMFYYFNGILWISSESGRHLKKSITNDLPSFYLKEATRIQNQIRLSEDETQQEILKKKMGGLFNIVRKIQGYSSMNNIVGMVKIYIEKSSNEVEFETAPYLFAFEDRIYDLKANEWSEPCRDDYLCISTGYSWCEPSNEDMDTFDKFLDTIFPHADEKKLYMIILATGLCGKTLEKFINANGSGGNGKGVINELAEMMFGNYAYNCANAVLLNPIKDGNNPTVANMKNKRIIFYREPDTTEQKKLNIATIKELTGGKAINARMNYSNDTRTVLVATHILECNERPKFSGRVDDAVLRRLIDILFRSIFTSKPDEYFGEYVFMKNDYYKSTEFQTKYRCVLFKTLIKYWKEYLDKKENIDVFICDSVKERTNSYLEANDEMKSWFDDHYERTGNRDDILQIKDIYDDFKNSEIWQNISKRERRELNKKGFTEKISGNIHFRKYYKEREKSKMVQEKYGVSLMRNVFVGFVKIEKYSECLLDIDDDC